MAPIPYEVCYFISLPRAVIHEISPQYRSLMKQGRKDVKFSFWLNPRGNELLCYLPIHIAGSKPV
ncbi:hypothetical protein AC578_3095 [Pseudocercospora eumusae]|uniref:Uncharacterized protein n=1 Tax=Pseudocercospora eumusae TaxID=321146 RepID=A0A139H1Q6_9PEZI|nr:hypothetical protein AC578_3095 [Pseudocercospora eumusae]